MELDIFKREPIYKCFETKTLTIDEVLSLPEGTEYYVYNPLTESERKEIAGKNDIAHNKHRFEKLVYYIYLS